MLDTLPKRMQDKIQVKDECWIWIAAKDKRGYGRISRVSYGTSSAHRYIYQLVGNRLVSGLELDHLCRVPSCVNPGHLEQVTHRENARRGEAGKYQIEKYAIGNRKYCSKGHPWVKANIYLWKMPTGYTRRQCKLCKTEVVREARRKKMGERF